MQVIRQDTDRNRFERVPLFDGSVHVPKMIGLADQEITRSVRQCNSEEKDSSVNPGAMITRHGRMLSTKTWWAKARPSWLRCYVVHGAFAHPTESASSPLPGITPSRILHGGAFGLGTAQ